MDEGGASPTQHLLVESSRNSEDWWQDEMARFCGHFSAISEPQEVAANRQSRWLYVIADQAKRENEHVAQ